MIVKIENMNKKFGDLDIFENFNLYVRENEFVAIIGKSGSGKSTLLNICLLYTSFIKYIRQLLCIRHSPNLVHRKFSRCLIEHGIHNVTDNVR